VLARYPQAKAQRQYIDVYKAAHLQRELLRAAIDCVKVGGYVLYSTCSVAVEENEAVVDYVIKNRHCKVVETGLPEEIQTAGYTKWKDRRFGDKMALTRRVYPHVENMDGFYIAKLKKTKDGVRVEYAEEPEKPTKAEKKEAKSDKKNKKDKKGKKDKPKKGDKTKKGDKAKKSENTSEPVEEKKSKKEAPQKSEKKEKSQDKKAKEASPGPLKKRSLDSKPNELDTEDSSKAQKKLKTNSGSEAKPKAADLDEKQARIEELRRKIAAKKKNK